MENQNNLIQDNEADETNGADDFHAMTEEETPTCKGMLKDLKPEDIDNEYIITGYRVHFKGIKKVLSTMFMMHNETFNIWSHFIGQLFYLAIAITILVSFPDMNDVGIDALIQRQYSS